MAADHKPDWLSCLPTSWSYGVTRDGRIFFINEEAKSTTWLQPVVGEAVITGHRKTPDLPRGWEEGFTFEGARCFINHNERKVTCKHPVSGAPSQDNCIFVVNEPAKYGTLVHPDKPVETDARTAPKSEQENSTDKKERPLSTMSEASNYTGGSDNSNFTGSPATTVTLSSSFTRPSRSSKKVHNFGKRSNSIKRNINAPVVKSNWLYKQDSTGMKLWKKRWFVLSDMCLFYYRDEKEDSILGSILLPSFHISMLSVDDHISRKYAFKATHPNMRTYYFCTDTAKEMESWMKVMTDAALVHVKNSTLTTGKCPHIDTLDNVKVDQPSTQELNNILNNRVSSRPEIQNNERNRVAPVRHHSLSRTDDKREYSTFQKDGGKYCVKQDHVSYVAQKDGEKYVLRKGGDKYPLRKNGEKYIFSEALPKDTWNYAPQKEVKRQLSLRETQSKYGTLQIVDKYNTLKDVKKYSTLREGDKYATLRDLEKYATLRHGEKRHFRTSQVNGSGERTSESNLAAENENQARVPVTPVQEVDRLSRSNSFQQSERVRGTEEDRSVPAYQTLPRNMPSHHPQLVPRYPEGYRTLPRNSMMRPDSICSVAGSAYDRALRPASTSTVATAEKRRSMRDDTMWQLYEWQQRQAFSRQSLAQPTGHYGTLPSTKTMSNISEHAAIHSIPTSPSHGTLAVYNALPAPDASVSHSEVPSSNFREDGTLERQHRTHPAKFGSTLERRPVVAGVSPQTITAQSLQGKTPEELTLMLIKLRRQQAELNSLREHTVSQLMALGIEGPNPKTDVLSHHLQRNLVYLDNQKKENEPLIFTIHAMIEKSAPRPQLYQQIPSDDYKNQPPEDTDTKLSRFCEQDKLVRMQEEKLQQLHREKHTLETALLSASQELNDQSNPSTTGTQSLIQQRDVLQNGLLSTCREVSRVNTELERAWREYDRLEGDVTMAKSNLLEQLEALGSPQTEPPSQRHIQIQKELWRIQDVMEALSKNKPQRSIDYSDSKPLSSQQKNEAVTLLPLSPLKTGNDVPPRPPLPQYYYSSEPPPHMPSHPPNSSGRPPPYTQREDRKARNGAHSQGPDYRLYKSEPELTTVKEEVDEVNGEDKDKNEIPAEKNEIAASSKVALYPVGVVPPRSKSPMSPPESTTIASYVTLRKTKKPEPKSDRPRSALVDQIGYVEREVGRPRMSLEEQLERMRRHQEASSQREKRREALSRSHSFSKEEPQVRELEAMELEVALKQVKMLQNEQTRIEDEEGTYTGRVPSTSQLQTAVILEQHAETQRVEIVNLHSFEEDKSREDMTSSPTNITTESSFQSSFPETPSPELKEEEEDVDVLQQNATEEDHRESYKQLPENDKKINNNNLLASQMFTMVSNDT
ncbi:pleckstrin homology domain-containing family A member 5-like isoform X2 [Corythoichthys intestinalis]|uniref:pleckstrin homology domain-containing family A member 5-like isoform X2 n=1 Tax=Corythoichthys intestinalis TaxID=161448 RepID=UPI0025A551B9|nr:pleckstrin homology domain-containing family A member 5-like isoform X2 [Corythoichthys intestinalis]